MGLSLVTLCENTAARLGLLGEWGLSQWVEVDRFTILLDTGGGLSLLHNAQALGIDLAEAHCLILSHGHADHTGGLREALRRKGAVEVIAHPDIWAPKYARFRGEPERHIGLPFVREELESLGARFRLSREPVKLSEKVTTLGEIPMVTEYEVLEKELCVRRGASLETDDLPDDQALAISTEEGLAVLLGCAHRGVINTLKRAQELTGQERIYAVVGGMHLFRATAERVELTIAALKEMGVKRVGAAHCTGLQVAARLAQEFGDGFFYDHAGVRMKLV